MAAELAPLKSMATRYLRYCSSIDLDDNILIAHRPWDGLLNYALRVFRPAKKSWIKGFKVKRIPEPYRDFLLSTNGLFAFGLTLYGLPPSRQGSAGLLDRSK